MSKGVSCPVCYEKYTADDPRLIPRQLQCQDILCTGCISAEFLDNCFYCPECGQEHRGNTIDDISFVTNILQEEMEPEPVRESLSAPTSPMNALAAFKQATADAPQRPASLRTYDRPHRSSDPLHVRWGQCKEVGCGNKACGPTGFCLKHSDNMHHSVVQESKLAIDLANTSLNYVTLEGKCLKLKNLSDGWPVLNPSELISRFKDQGRMELGEAMNLIDQAQAILSREPNVLRLQSPIVTVGDVHGQFYDLLNLLNVGGKVAENTYLFLGDYVDRGSFSCEVMLSLLALKVTYPKSIYLIRGNHECASVSGHFGFKEECKIKYGVPVYYKFLLLFQTMPLAAVISTDYGNIFACHGGLSPSLLTLDDIDRIDRFVEPEESPALLDILWSDPITEESTVEMTDEEYAEFIMVDWKPNPARGCSYCYGYKAVRDFLNNLLCIVRAHEVQESGYHRHFDPVVLEARCGESIRSLQRPRRKVLRREHSAPPDTRVTRSRSLVPFFGSLDEDNDPVQEDEEPYSALDEMPTVVTVFSAPNYCDRYGNKGAILRIDTTLDGFQVLQYDCVEHPKPEHTESQMNNHILAVIATCPYMPTSFRDFVRLAVELGPEVNLFDNNHSEHSKEELHSFASNSSSPPRSHAVEVPAAMTPPASTPQAHATPTESQRRGLFSPAGIKRNNSIKKQSSVRIPLISGEGFMKKDDENPDELQESTVPFSPAIRRRGSSDARLEGAAAHARQGLEALYDKSMNNQPANRVARSSSTSSSSSGPVRSKRASISGGHVYRYKVQVAHSNSYLQAHASDAINELHPDLLVQYMHNIESGSTAFRGKDKLFEMSETEKPAAPVSQLKKRFESICSKNNDGTIDAELAEMGLTPRKYSTVAQDEVIGTLQSGGRSRVQSIKEIFSGGRRSDGKITAKVVKKSESESERDMHRRASEGAYYIVETDDASLARRESSSTIASVEESTPEPVPTPSVEHASSPLPKTVKFNIGRYQVEFSNQELLALRLMFSLFDRSGNSMIGYEDLVAYAEETGDVSGIREAGEALEIVDIDGDGKIGLLDFIHFASRLQVMYQRNLMKNVMTELTANSAMLKAQESDTHSA